MPRGIPWYLMNDSSSRFHANPGETPLPPGSGLSRRFRTTPFWRALPGGMRRRWWMFRPLDLIARHWPVFKKPRGVLVVRMDGIGDMVLFRRTLDRYAEVFGVDKSEITVLGCASWANLADVVFEGYKVYAIDEHAFARRPFYRFKISLWVRGLAPAIGDVLQALRALPGCRLARMSGSGATCFALFDDAAQAAQSADDLCAGHAGWWIASSHFVRTNSAP